MITDQDSIKYLQIIDDMHTILRCHKKHEIDRLYFGRDCFLKRPKSIPFAIEMDIRLSAHHLKRIQEHIEFINQTHSKLKSYQAKSIPSNSATTILIELYNKNIKKWDKWNRIIENESIEDDWKTVLRILSAVSLPQNSDGCLLPIVSDMSKKSSSFNLERYFRIMKQYPEQLKYERTSNRGNKEAPQVYYDQEEIEKISKSKQEDLIKAGYSSQQAYEWCRPGIIAEDAHWIWMRDAVISPSGCEKMHNRLIIKEDFGKSKPGALLLIVESIQGKRIHLSLIFRHTTGAWELELPRISTSLSNGQVVEINQEKIETLNQEPPEPLHLLATLNRYCELSPSTIEIYSRTIHQEDQKNGENGKQELLFTVQEIEQGLRQQCLNINLGGSICTIPLRDPLLFSAIELARLNGQL